MWSDPDRRKAFQQWLRELGYDLDRLDDMRRLIAAPNSDIFDVLAYAQFTLASLSRAQRAGAARVKGLGGALSVMLFAIQGIRLWRWRLGKTDDCFVCGCLLGREREGRWGLYRKCLGCGKSHSARAG